MEPNFSVKRNTISMEEGRDLRCCCYEEGGGERRTCRRNMDRETFLQRMACFLTVVVLLLMMMLLLVAAVTLITLTERGHHHQVLKNPGSQSLRTSSKQLQIPDVTKPCAIIRAPFGNITNGKYLLWEHEKGLARCLGGFRYFDGNLVVPRKGMYRVFLQITFESRTKCSGELQLKVQVFALMDSYDRNILLLSAVDTANCNMTQWKKSLHTTGIVYLEANTQLRVLTPNPELIIRKEEFVLFGAELVTE